MKKQPFHCTLAVSLGLALVAFLLWLGTMTPARAGANIHCVNQTGTGCDTGVCGGGCYASVQAAVSAAPSGGEIRIADGTYIDLAGTVAAITKGLVMRGGYGQPCGDSDFDPDLHQTVLDAQWGGSVISITGAGDVTLENLTLTHGDGTGNLSGMGAGGGVFNKNTNLSVLNSVITDNLGSRAGQGQGGGIYSSQTSSHQTTLVGNRIVSNTAGTDTKLTADGDGGGIYISGGEASLGGNQIVDNLGHATNQCWGGGVELVNLTWGEVLNNVIRGNVGSKATDSNGYGSGLHVTGGQVRLSGNLIENNWSESGAGGGLKVDWSDIEITGNRIISNTSDAGGGMYIRSLTPVTITNNLVVRNNSSFRGGGVYLVHNTAAPTPAVLVNNTIADNGPDGVATWGYIILTMTNNLLDGNLVGIFATHPASLTITADTNLFWNDDDPITGTNAILQNPLLTSDYHLDAGSSAVDAGVTIPWLTDDLDGNSRPQGSGYDIGAYERVKVFLPLVLRNH